MTDLAAFALQLVMVAVLAYEGREVCEEVQQWRDLPGGGRVSTETEEVCTGGVFLPLLAQRELPEGLVRTARPGGTGSPGKFPVPNRAVAAPCQTLFSFSNNQGVRPGENRRAGKTAHIRKHRPRLQKR